MFELFPRRPSGGTVKPAERQLNSVVPIGRAVLDNRRMRQDDPLLWQSKSNRWQMNHAERRIWWDLRRNQFGVRFRRQPIVLGVLPDFACLPLKTIVEVDGSQHLLSEEDQIRDEILRAQGWMVLRFWSGEVFKDNEMVLNTISSAIHSRLPGPRASS